MKGLMILLAVAGVIAAVVALKGRDKKLPEHPLSRLRESADDTIADMEERIAELQQQARRVKGEAQKRVQERAHELEERQKELAGRFEELRSEARKLLERNHSQD